MKVAKITLKFASGTGWIAVNEVLFVGVFVAVIRNDSYSTRFCPRGRQRVRPFAVRLTA